MKSYVYNLTISSKPKKVKLISKKIQVNRLIFIQMINGKIIVYELKIKKIENQLPPK